MLRVGLLGAGRIGQLHAENIAGHTNSVLAAIADVNIEAASSLAERFDAKVMPSEAILTDKNIDAILIATSTDTHADLIEAATISGKAVLCEKPVDLNIERAQSCLARVSSTGRPVMIGFNRRFDKNFKALKAAYQAGEIGDGTLLSITSFDPAPPPISYIRVSGGLFRDMMIHDFDMANFIMEAKPVSLFAVGSAIVDPEIGNAGDVDTAIVTLTYADGRLAVIKNSRRAVYGYDQRIELLGAEGLLQAQNMLEDTIVKSTASGVTGAKPTYFFLERYMPAYAAEWDAFVHAVIADNMVPVTLADGVDALAMAEAATESARNRAPVALNWGKNK